MGQNIPQATILYTESKHNIVALVGKANKTEQKLWFILMSSWISHTFSFIFIFLVKEPHWLAHDQIFWNIGHFSIEAALWTPGAK